MADFTEIIGSIFYDLVERFDLKIIESNEQSILYQNNFCFLFVGHHMGETYVNIRKEKNGLIITPLMWSFITNKLDYKNTIPLMVFDPEAKLMETLKYNFVVEKTLISLFCLDLLSGDFSNLDFYRKNLEKKNNEIYDYNLRHKN